MIYYLVKITLTTALIVLISEISKRHTMIAALLASVPLTSVLAMIWLFWETRDTEQIRTLSQSIFWLVLPSLVLFLALPYFLHKGLGFAFSLLLAITATVISYGVMLILLKHLQINL